MTTVIVGMLIALLIAGVVVALVAVPARREGREILTPQGEQMVQTARERTVEAVGVARDKVGDLAEKLPIGGASDEPVAPTASRTGAAAPTVATASSDVDLRPATDAAQHRL